jgi:hypothetical protein
VVIQGHIFYFSVMHYSRGKVKENETDGACGVREIHTVCWLGNVKERDHLKDLGVDGRIDLNI